MAEFEGRTGVVDTLKNSIEADSALYGLYARIRGVLGARRVGLDHERVDHLALRYTRFPNLSHHKTIAMPRVQRFARRMSALLRVVRATGSVPVCVTQPTLYHRRNGAGVLEGVALTIDNLSEGAVNGVDYFHMRALQDAHMLAACREADSVIVDLASESWRPEEFYDLTHLTPAGATRVGLRIADVMKGLPF